jgi:hypothetical protein
VLQTLITQEHRLALIVVHTQPSLGM